MKQFIKEYFKALSVILICIAVAFIIIGFPVLIMHFIPNIIIGIVYYILITPLIVVVGSKLLKL